MTCLVIKKVHFLNGMWIWLSKVSYSFRGAARWFWRDAGNGSFGCGRPRPGPHLEDHASNKSLLLVISSTILSITITTIISITITLIVPLLLYSTPCCDLTGWRSHARSCACRGPGSFVAWGLELLAFYVPVAGLNGHAILLRVINEYPFRKILIFNAFFKDRRLAN